MTGVILRCPNCGTSKSGSWRMRCMPRGASPLLLHEPQARALARCLRMSAMRRKIRRSGPSGGKAHSACRSASSTDDGHVRCTVARRSSAIAPENQRQTLGPQRTGEISRSGSELQATRAPRCEISVRQECWRSSGPLRVPARMSRGATYTTPEAPPVGASLGGCLMRFVILAMFLLISFFLMLSLVGGSLFGGYYF